MMKKKTEGKNLISRIFREKKAVNIGIAVVLSVLFVAFGISAVTQSGDISRLEQQKAEVSAQYDEQTKENKELQAVLDNENKDDYIEKKAREKGYVKSNEVVFYDISASE
ncbi:MAG: septum formation initiator family protein [Eubacteriales bacterium]|nr:septum formation initiator family protein [Eubacteriales bacterium]